MPTIRPSTTPTPTRPTTTPTLRPGANGNDVKALQRALLAAGQNVQVDGDYGPTTERAVKAFQTANGMMADGVVGPATWTALERSAQPAPAPAPATPARPVETQSSPTLRPGANGDDVKALQRALIAAGQQVSVDGNFGPGTVRAVKAFQAANGMTADGVVGPSTWNALRGDGGVSPARPSNGPSLAGEIRTGVQNLAPTLSGISATPALAALGDGTANITIPLKAGEYKIKGVPFTVRPGTKVTMRVDVRNGELVPAQGNRGTQMSINPPLDLPLWVEGNGARVVGDAAHQRFQVELGGFFDLSFGSARLSDLATGGMNTSGNSDMSRLMTKMADLDNLKIDAKVSAKNKTIDLGGMKVKVDSATKLELHGNGREATLTGHVELDGVNLNQNGVSLKTTSGSAELSAVIRKSGDAVAVETSLTNVKATIEQLRSAKPSVNVPGQTDSVALGQTQITAGEIHSTSHFSLSGRPQISTGRDVTTMKLKGAGHLANAKLNVRDDQGSSTFVGSGDFDGTIEVGAGGAKIDAKLKDAHVDVSDLQQTVQGNRISVEHARGDGDFTVHTDSSTGKVQVDGSARNLDIVLNDFKGGTGKAQADLGRSTLTGSGKLHIGADGLSADGHLAASVAIDNAKVDDGHGHKAVIDWGTSVSGDLTHLKVGGGAAPELRIANVNVDAKVKNAAFDVGQATLQGEANVKGRANVTFDANGLDLQGSATVSMKLDDGRVHSSNVDLDLARGSNAQLTISELSLGRTTKVNVAAGSRIEAVLDSGKLHVSGQDVALESGAKALFTVKKVNLAEGQAPDIRGSLSIDGKVKANQVTVPTANTGGVQVRPSDVAGRVVVNAEDVQLSNNRFSLDNANVRLDANIGRVIGSDGTAAGGVGSLSAAPNVLSVNDIKTRSAESIAGVHTQPLPQTQPADALKLLRAGELKLEVPLQGGISALGIDVLKFPPGSKADVRLAVRDGKIVAEETSATLSGGVKALGVEILGVTADSKNKLHVKVKVLGRELSLPVPGVRLPADMEQLAELTKPKASRSSFMPDMSEMVDLSNARLDVDNATFAEGQLGLPGGAVQIDDGSKLSFHGTPDAGSLTGTVNLSQVAFHNDGLALNGTAGHGELKVDFKREGNKAVVDAQVKNLSFGSDYLVRKQDNGDYVSLGKGRIQGASISLRSEVELDARGLPVATTPKVSDVTLEVPTFSGDLKSARVTSGRDNLPGVMEMGAAHIEGGLSFNRNGLSVKANVDRLDAGVRGVRMQNRGQAIDLQSARLKGGGGTIDIGPGRIAFNTRQLQYDAVLKEVAAAAGTTSVRAGQLHIFGNGKFAYDSATELRVDGQLSVEGNLSAAGVLPTGGNATGLTIGRGRNVEIRR